MNDIGKALAGNSIIKDRGNPIMPEKYISPFSEMIKGIVNDVKNKGPSDDDYRRCLADLAERYLVIVDCEQCQYPNVESFNCPYCTSSST